MKNNILVINCGSSSVKFSLIDSQNHLVIVSALAEQLLSPQACITFKQHDEKQLQKLNAPHDHLVAINAFVDFITERKLISTITAVGHRVVHGGESYSTPALITDDVKQEIKRLATLAPLHNPANLLGIEATEQVFKNLPQVAIFDTSFHQTMPKHVYLYPLPYELYQQHGIRKYGFHGTSHYFVANQAAALLNKPLNQCNLISAHLGNGCSVTAIKQGQSVDTSLGLTPLEGLMMGTRSGSIDPSIIFHLVDTLGYSLDQVNTMLNKASGLKGISQLSNDCRELESAAMQGHEFAQLALDMFCYRVAKTIASFTVCFNTLDGIIFTGGIGENSSYIREKVMNQLSLINVTINAEANNHTRFGANGNIAATNSTPCWVISTDEEAVIAMQTNELVKQEQQ